MSTRRVCDQEVRDRITTDLSTTLLLEAGAGTGKTRVLVDRYVRCVLDPERGTGDVTQVAAITFTEKAAGELRQRVREEFELRAASAEPGSPEAAVVERAVETLDDAPISTIHGFASRLLRELPVEAGVDPAFEQLDALGAQLERERLWEEWLAAVVGGEPGAADDLAEVRRWLTRLLHAGVRLEAVRDLAVSAGGVFDERYSLDPPVDVEVELDLSGRLALLMPPLESLRSFSAAACRSGSDKGLLAAQELLEACERLLSDPPGDVEGLAAKLYRLPANTSPTAPGGVRKNWDDALGGKEELQFRYGELVATVVEVRELYSDFVTQIAVALADAFARWAGERQIASGVLDFADLLGRLRDLLVSDLEARAELQGRFRYLLVDEFQDTDPLQAEIAFLLCERRPRARDWRAAELEPGKLFVVGDPKQSIYRFRRADISLYDEVKALIAAQPDGTGDVVAIRQNFRTTPAVLEWVNDVFGELFEREQEVGRQPGYQVLEPYRPSAEGSRVSVVLGREYERGETRLIRRDEARALAALLASIVGSDAESWRVQDRAATPPEHGGEVTRPPRWRDIALLVRTTTDLEIYERALREAEVPYRVEGGATYFARREVADALLCLRAADDPSDGPAVYGALHSCFFGFSDEELFCFSAAGGRFDPFADEQPEGYEGVVEALRVLRALHGRRAVSEPHELVAELLRLVHSVEFFAATGSGAPQALANLEKLAERARAFAGAGLGAFLAWAAQAGDSSGEQESLVDDEGDSVRLLTIHKAKGLEYPIVVLVGGALGGGSGGRNAASWYVDRGARRLVPKLKAALPGGVEAELKPGGYEELKEHEKEMEESELRRLLYVAATRARDRLVVSCFGSLLTQRKQPRASVLLAPIHGALPELGATAPQEAYEFGDVLVLPPGEPPQVGRGAAPDAASSLAERGAWLAARRELLAEASAPAAITSPSALEEVDEGARIGGAGAPPGRALALALGSAVHRAMELCNLADESSLASAARAAAREVDRPELAERVAELAGACWRAAPARAAARAAAADSAAVYRELPVGAVVDGVVVSGSVDLLYRDGGAWVVVDYKTDRSVDPEVLIKRYGPQGAAYALVVEAALEAAGLPGRVREVVFVAAGAAPPGGVAPAVIVPVSDELRARARREIVAAAAQGRAVCGEESAAP